MTNPSQTMGESFEEEAQQLLRRSDQYWVQALEQLEGDHLEKASELAWGSVVERIKALALAKTGQHLQRHRRIKNYVRRVAASVGDEELFRVFQRAESLHINFYESFFELDEIREAFNYIRELLPRVDSYIFGDGR